MTPKNDPFNSSHYNTGGPSFPNPGFAEADWNREEVAMQQAALQQCRGLLRAQTKCREQAEAKIESLRRLLIESQQALCRAVAREDELIALVDPDNDNTVDVVARVLFERNDGTGEWDEVNQTPWRTEARATIQALATYSRRISYTSTAPCATCGHAIPHDWSGIGICGVTDCGCDGPVVEHYSSTFKVRSTDVMHNYAITTGQDCPECGEPWYIYDSPSNTIRIHRFECGNGHEWSVPA